MKSKETHELLKELVELQKKTNDLLLLLLSKDYEYPPIQDEPENPNEPLITWIDGGN